MKTQKRWCGVCNFLVYDPHSHPTPPPPRARTVGDLYGAPANDTPPLLRRMGMKAKRREPALLMLSFGPLSIAGNSTANICAGPQVLFKPMRLVVPPEVGVDFYLSDLQIGRMSQFANPGGAISMSAFPPLPVKEQPINNLKGMPCVMVGQSIYMTVQNHNPACRNFTALVYGVTLYDDSAPIVYDDEDADEQKPMSDSELLEFARE